MSPLSHMYQAVYSISNKHNEINVHDIVLVLMINNIIRLGVEYRPWYCALC